MSTRLPSRPLGDRLNKWLERYADDRHIKRAQEAEAAWGFAIDSYEIEHDKVRHLTDRLADRDETIDHLNEEIDQMQSELAALYRAHRRLEMELDAARGELAGTSVADEVEAFLAHPSNGGEEA